MWGKTWGNCDLVDNIKRKIPNTEVIEMNPTSQRWKPIDKFHKNKKP